MSKAVSKIGNISCFRDLDLSHTRFRAELLYGGMLNHSHSVENKI